MSLQFPEENSDVSLSDIEVINPEDLDLDEDPPTPSNARTAETNVDGFGAGYLPQRIRTMLEDLTPEAEEFLAEHCHVYEYKDEDRGVIESELRHR